MLLNEISIQVAWDISLLLAADNVESPISCG